MYKVFILNRAKDSKGVSKYKIIRLFIHYFLIKFLFIMQFYKYDVNFFAVFFEFNLKIKLSVFSKINIKF
ncbi:hypothetical protein RC62_2498 [Flavobacterium aquidurense]|uniref:Uncharacterized protein n=1 Tax=Flavobacterium aquidurense TaxID=362413 RepID=A0A0N8VLS4_9FLAO|nr:hypothetical protein RC62_2498 [Flavobacterium aquidurense]